MLRPARNRCTTVELSRLARLAKDGKIPPDRYGDAARLVRAGASARAAARAVNT